MLQSSSTPTRRLVEDADRRPSDRDAANELRQQVLNAPGPKKAWPRITTVLAAFDEQALTPEAASRIDRALAEAGIVVEPNLAELDSRSGTVLSLPKRQRMGLGTDFEDVLENGLTDEVLSDRRRAVAADRQSIGEAVRGVCRKASEEIITDIYLSDAIPKIQAYENARAVSAAAFEAREPEHRDARSGAAGTLHVQLVELVAGDGWLITSWHRERVIRGAREELATGDIPTDDGTTSPAASSSDGSNSTRAAKRAPPATWEFSFSKS